MYFSLLFTVDLPLVSNQCLRRKIQGALQFGKHDDLTLLLTF